MRLNVFALALIMAVVVVAAPQDSAVTHLERGNALLSKRDLDGAIAEYREVLRRVDLQGGVYRRAQRFWYDIAKRAVA